MKAHGYGHGGPAVARAALAGGARQLAVALVDEGVELREHGVTAPVLLLSECDPAAAETALAFGLTPTLYSAGGIDAFAVAARRRAVRWTCTSRWTPACTGSAPHQRTSGAIAAAVVAEPALRLEGVWTHLPVADGEQAEDRAYTEGQLDLFEHLVGDLRAAGIDPPLLHAANTAAAVAFPRRGTGWCAAALGSTATCRATTRADGLRRTGGGRRLHPAMSLKAQVVAVRTLEAGERPSYGRLRPLPARSLRGHRAHRLCRRGAARPLHGGYEVLIGGVRRPLAGMVTMDQIVVDCGADETVRPGDEVVLLGRQGAEAITADDWAATLGTISYEVVCGVGPRMPRILVNRPDVPGV